MLAGAFILQEPSFMSWVWFLAKPFMSEKITSRFHLCGHRTDILKENVPDFSILPNHLGGDLPDDDVAINSWITDRVADMSKKEPSQGWGSSQFVVWKRWVAVYVVVRSHVWCYLVGMGGNGIEVRQQEWGRGLTGGYWSNILYVFITALSRRRYNKLWSDREIGR